VPLCEEHGVELRRYRNGLDRQGQPRNRLRCPLCATLPYRQPPKGRQPPARVCAKGHSLLPYGTKGMWRCPTCRRVRAGGFDREAERERARKKMLRAEIVQELQRRGVEYVPRSPQQNLEDAMRPVRFPGEAV
jgi:hypothetical protein